jgi:signal peptidase II
MIKNQWKYYLIVLIVVVIDQWSKLWVHFNIEMGYLGSMKLIGNWFKIHYTLNPGMAFGIQFGFKYGKLLLTLGRIVASCMIGQYIWQLAREQHVPVLLLWGWALVLGGAVGNVIDSTFYAVLLDNAPHDAPMSWFYGQVIDMVYLDIWEGKLPTWLPRIGGRHLSLLPIFNIADVAIFLGVSAILWARSGNPRATGTVYPPSHPTGKSGALS